MKRTTIMLSEEIDARLRYESRRRGVSVAEMAREAIAAYLPRHAADLAFFSVGEGDPPDVSERVDEFVAQAVIRRSNRP